MKHSCRNKKNVFKNLGGGLLFYLSSISLIGVGFSSWIINPLSNTQVDINIHAADIINANFFSISADEIKMFTLGPSGLVEDKTIVNESLMELSFYIDNIAAYPSTDQGLLNFEIILSCSNETFLNAYVSNPTISGTASLTSSNHGTEIISDVSYVILETGNTKITATYKVTDKADTNGKYMADLYYSNKPIFNFKVRGK